VNVDSKRRRRLGLPNLSILLSEIVERIGVIGPNEQGLKAIVAGNSGRAPDEMRDHGAMVRPLDAKTYHVDGNRRARDADAEAEIGKIYRQSDRRRVI
jgi:hypothetical protein